MAKQNTIHVHILLVDFDANPTSKYVLLKIRMDLMHFDLPHQRQFHHLIPIRLASFESALYAYVA